MFCQMSIENRPRLISTVADLNWGERGAREVAAQSATGGKAFLKLWIGTFGNQSILAISCYFSVCGGPILAIWKLVWKVVDMTGTFGYPFSVFFLCLWARTDASSGPGTRTAAELGDGEKAHGASLEESEGQPVAGRQGGAIETGGPSSAGHAATLEDGGDQFRLMVNWRFRNLKGRKR